MFTEKESSLLIDYLSLEYEYNDNELYNKYAMKIEKEIYGIYAKISEREEYEAF